MPVFHCHHYTILLCARHTQRMQIDIIIATWLVGWLAGWLVVLVICSQMAVQIEVPLGMEVHLGHGQTLLGRGRVPQKWAFCVL